VGHLNARFRCSVKARSHRPDEQATLTYSTQQASESAVDRIDQMSAATEPDPRPPSVSIPITTRGRVDPERILRPEEQRRAGDAADVMVGVGAAGRDFERRAREPSTRRSTQNS